MPVSGSQEPGVLSQQSSICYSDIPIKKRRFPFVPPPSPPREDTPVPISEIRYTANKRESTGIGLSVVANTSKDSIQKSVVINSLKDVKNEIDADTNANSMLSDICTQPRAMVSCHTTQLDEEFSPAVIPGSVHKVNRNFSSLVNEISASPSPNSNPRFPSVDVKKEMVNIRSEGDCRHELSTTSGSTKLYLSSNELVGSPSVNQKVGLSTKVPDKFNPLLLSLLLSETELPESLNADKTVSDSNVMSSTDRSNWDLNTTMDAWEGSIEDASSNDTVGADELSSSGATHDVKHFLSSSSVVNVRVDKGKQVMEPFEERSTLCIPSMSLQQFNADDSLSLCLSTSSPHDSSRVMRHLVLQRPIINSISSGSGIVKSEHVDEHLKPDLFLVPGGTMESLDNTLIKKRNAESCEASSTLVGNFRKLIEPTSFKSEVSHESNQETHSAANFTLKQPGGNIVQHQESCSSSSTVVSGSITHQQPFVTKLTTCSEPTGVGVLDQSEQHSNTPGMNIMGVINPSINTQMPEAVNNYCEDPIVCDDRKVDSSKSMTYCLRSGKNNIETNNTITEESTSDKEKIYAMVEDVSYGSDYESDGNHAVECQTGRDNGQNERLDDDYEDGEVIEFTVKSLGEDPICEAMLSENIKVVGGGCEIDVSPNQATISEKNNDIKIHDENNDHNERLEAITNLNNNQLLSLPVTISEEKVSAQTQPIVPEKSLVDPSGEEKVPGVKENELMGDRETNMKDLVPAAVSVARNENDKGSKEAGIKDNGSNVDGALNSSLSKEDELSLGLGSNRSRIITLPRASDSPSRMRSFSGRAFTLWSVRERYGDVDGNNLYYRGHRDDTHGDDSREFTRDQSFRNPRMDFKRDRGRGNGRLDSLQNKWDPEPGFSSRSFDVSSDYRFHNRHRHASAIADNGLWSNDFDAQDGTGPNTGRIGRKNSTDEFHSFRQPSSRRLSPEHRDGATIRSVPNLRRIPDSGSDIPGLRHEKFLRGSPDDISGSVYTRPQASYGEMDDQLVDGNQDYSTIQRRSFTRARSKAPVSTQPRSPPTWTSSRRRFYDDFNNPSDQIQHRSVMNKVESMRSLDRVYYTNELGDRRRVSPNYGTRCTNEMRNMDFTRERGHLRSISSNRRSPSDQAFPRSTRRLDEIDSRERTESDEYFSGPIHSGRFHEFRGNGCNDERRKFGERQSQFRPSRPSHGGGNENHRSNAEDGTRPLRFCSDQDTESFNRNNIRRRDFDGGTKPRPLIAQRQMRKTEDQEGGLGQTEQVWHDESFSDGSGIKRRRF